MKFLPLFLPFYKAEKNCHDEDKRIECEGLGLFLIIFCIRTLKMFIGTAWYHRDGSR